MPLEMIREDKDRPDEIHAWAVETFEDRSPWGWETISYGFCKSWLSALTTRFRYWRVWRQVYGAMRIRRYTWTWHIDGYDWVRNEDGMPMFKNAVQAPRWQPPGFEGLGWWERQ